MTQDEKNALAEVLATKFDHAERRVLLNEMGVAAEAVTLAAPTASAEAWEIVGYFERRDGLDRLRAKVERERPAAATAGASIEAIQNPLVRELLLMAAQSET